MSRPKICGASGELRDLRSHPDGIGPNSEPLKQVFQHFDMEDPVALPCLQASLNSMKGVLQVLLAVS